MNTPLEGYLTAIGFAVVKHGNQKYGGGPYINHLRMVERVLEEHGCKSPAFAIGAWLHDTIEDSENPDKTYSEIKEFFGPVMADIVLCVSDDVRPGECRPDYKGRSLQRTATNRISVGIKLADRIANWGESLEYFPTKTAMYLEEYAQFKEILWRDGEYTSMWAKLDEIEAQSRERSLSS